jgi:signal transduction histidine kinase
VAETPASPSDGRLTGSVRGARVRSAPVAWSLERRLPVLISVLVACVVGGLGFAAYRETRSAAIDRTSERLERVGRELVETAARATAVRDDALRALADEPLIRNAVAGVAATAGVAARLDAARDPSDSTLLAWQIATVAGEPRVSTGVAWAPADSAALSALTGAVIESGATRHSPFYAVGDRVHAWVATPILVGGRAVGTLAALRRVGDNAGADATIRRIVDDDARMLFTSLGSREWASPRGRPVSAPFALPATQGTAVRVQAGDDGAFAVQNTVPGTPWTVVLFQSQASVLRRPHEFLRGLVGAGLLVLAVATLGAWLLSRHVTRPLRDVTAAVASLAHGKYDRRVDVSGGGLEMATLGSTFNGMAAAIGDAHAQLAERNAELQRANAAKAQFLAMMSHELRTPLNAIGGFTELMELGLRGPVTPEQVEDLGRIRRNKDLLLSIIGDILDFTRAEAGVLTVELEPVLVAPLLGDVVSAVGRQIEAKGVRLVVSAVPANAIARADHAKMQQVVLNLLSNALKFTEPGGEVRVDTRVDGAMVYLDVRDTGPGIDADQLEAVFEPFVQADSSLTRRAGGTGLGLAIARQLATAMRGSVTVRSTVGAGSTFTLALPHAERAGVSRPPQPISSAAPQAV